jgi:hypothetical protein
MFDTSQLRQGPATLSDLIDPTLPTAVAPTTAAAPLPTGSATPNSPSQATAPPAAALATIRPSSDQIPSLKAYQPDPTRQRYEAQLQRSLYDQENRPKPQGFWGNAGHILNGIANAAGDVLIGNKMSLIPGTMLNRASQHDAGVRELTQLKNQDLQDQTAFERGQSEQSQNQLRTAQSQEARARADALAGGEILYDKNGDAIGFHDGKGNFLPQGDPNLPPGVAQVMGAAKPKLAEGDQPLTNVQNLTKDLQDRYDVLHPGSELPPEYALPANATQKDYDRIDKALEAQERAEGTREQQEQTKLLRQQAEADREATRAMQQNRLSAADRKEIYTIYQPSMQSAERFNVMAQNYEDAIKNHDQQAMLSLLANHLGMTMGLQKGARLTKDIINEAKNSRPWLQGMEAKFDKQGYLSGVTLTPEQMRQMVDLGASRYREDTVNARNAAKYMGANDDGPARSPNAATVRYYTNLANGDAAKAKSLAAEDGWTIQ